MEDLMSSGMRYANQVLYLISFQFSYRYLFFLILLAIILLFFSQALLSGCSAGGLASILHCDEFRDLFPRTTRVKCLSDAGLFLDV
jgi:hypothetical protein